MQATVTRDGRILLRNRQGVVCAGILPDGTLYREVRRSRHLLRKPCAWSFEREVLEQAHEAGVRVVEVHDLETGERYTAPLARLWQKGIRLNRGAGEQIALTLNHWHKQHPEQMTLF